MNALQETAAAAAPATATALSAEPDAESAFAVGFAVALSSLNAWRSPRRRGESELTNADAASVGFTSSEGLLHAVRTYACVRKQLGRKLSAKCNVTIQFTPVCEHIDHNSAKPNGFLESLSSIYLTAIKHRNNSARPSSHRLEGALYMPRAGVAVRRRPCWAIHVVYFDDEPHSVFAPPTAKLRLLRGVGGDPDFGVATIADW